ncbi:hypothetical protein OJF2_15100 [Aquisphaera giovannonii]|uniref:Uncharacterized protein n=1 Tax=Aquisphaera giovannonii TaxID=406548 RepID=A0A5B9VZ20_9BACT|nr:hypothetical protein [Aquisphaera giovannonii]QEH33015.1 hypothetical protein OJF2_15100 [Aquisphaera giovannonii]
MAGDASVTDSGAPNSSRFEDSSGTCIQEWTGSEWVVIETFECAAGYESVPLDPSAYPGDYVGARVITPCVPRGDLA